MGSLDPGIRPTVPTAGWQVLEHADEKWSLVKVDCTAG